MVEAWAYAETVVRDYVSRLDRTVFLVKDVTTLGLVSPGDIVVDDDAGMRALTSVAGAISRTPWRNGHDEMPGLFQDLQQSSGVPPAPVCSTLVKQTFPVG